jgi:hypothetical protein
MNPDWVMAFGLVVLFAGVLVVAVREERAVRDRDRTAALRIAPTAVPLGFEPGPVVAPDFRRGDLGAQRRDCRAAPVDGQRVTA